MSSMMHMPWVLVMMVAVFAVVIVGLFVAGRVFSTRQADRDKPRPESEPRGSAE